MLDVRKLLLEIKIGVFILGAAALVFVAALSIREISFMEGSYIIKVDFNFAEGLKSSSPVRFCGVNVGEVKRVEVIKTAASPTVYVYAKIQRSVQIPSNSRFLINSLSLFGEKYLEIIPPEEVDGYIKENEVVEGISPVPLFNVMASFHKTMQELDAFVNEDEFKESIKEIVLNIKGVTGDLHAILQEIKSQEGNLGRFIYDDSLYQKTEEFIEDIKQNPWKLLYKPKKRRCN